MEQRITFMTLGVNDLKVSTDFYENKFGWKRSEMSNLWEIAFNPFLKKNKSDVIGN